VIGSDKKRRLSDGGLWTLLATPTGRAHVVSAIRYFCKWPGTIPEKLGN
jgi:hypothetical protein